MPRSGMNGMDFEANVNFSRLRSDRLSRAKQSMKDYGLNALVCYDFDNIRYITGTHIGEWNRNKMNRYCILIDGVEQPFLFDPAATIEKTESRLVGKRSYYACSGIHERCHSGRGRHG